jgi:hypothetical protein
MPKTDIHKMLFAYRSLQEAVPGYADAGVEIADLGVSI